MAKSITGRFSLIAVQNAVVWEIEFVDRSILWKGTTADDVDTEVNFRIKRTENDQVTYYGGDNTLSGLTYTITPNPSNSSFSLYEDNNDGDMWEIIFYEDDVLLAESFTFTAKYKGEVVATKVLPVQRKAIDGTGYQLDGIPDSITYNAETGIWSPISFTPIVRKNGVDQGIGTYIVKLCQDASGQDPYMYNSGFDELTLTPHTQYDMQDVMGYIGQTESDLTVNEISFYACLFEVETGTLRATKSIGTAFGGSAGADAVVYDLVASVAEITVTPEGYTNEFRLQVRRVTGSDTVIGGPDSFPSLTLMGTGANIKGNGSYWTITPLSAFNWSSMENLSFSLHAGSIGSMRTLATLAIPVRKTGVAGAVIRVREWSSESVTYECGDVFYGDTYLDIVHYTDNDKNEYYQCLKTHTSTPDNPLTPSTSTEYWKEASNFGFIATQLLLAEQAQVRLMQGNQLLITDQENNVVGGLSGYDTESSDIRMWVGAEEPSEAPYRVYEDGKVETLYRREAWTNLTDMYWSITGEVGKQWGRNYLDPFWTGIEVRIVIGSDPKYYDYAGEEHYTSNVGGTKIAVPLCYNYICTGYGGFAMRVALPTDKSYIGTRVMLFNADSGTVYDEANKTVVVIEEGKAFRGCGTDIKYVGEVEGVPIGQIKSFTAVKQIEFWNGIMEFVGVPDSDGSCTWCIINDSLTGKVFRAEYANV